MLVCKLLSVKHSTWLVVTSAPVVFDKPRKAHLAITGLPVRPLSGKNTTNLHAPPMQDTPRYERSCSQRGNKYACVSAIPGSTSGKAASSINTTALSNLPGGQTYHDPYRNRTIECEKFPRNGGKFYRTARTCAGDMSPVASESISDISYRTLTILLSLDIGNVRALKWDHGFYKEQQCATPSTMEEASNWSPPKKLSVIISRIADANVLLD